MIRKLFTSILLLGAVGYAQAQVTVTAFDAAKKTVTINYNRAAGLSTESMVEDAIKAAFQGLNGQDPTMVSTAMPDPAMKAAVATIKLTGDWENRDTDKDGAKTIKKIVDKFSDPNAPDTLDLSACTKFCSEFISVKDVINGQEMGPTDVCPGYSGDQHVTTFTANYKLPDETTTLTLTKETTAGEMYFENNNPGNKLDKNSFESEDAYNDFIDEVNNGTHTDSYVYNYKPNPNQTFPGYLKYYSQGTPINAWPYTVQQSGWYWESEQGTEVKLLTITYNNTYYSDGNEVKVDNENALVDNGNGTYTYTQTITHDNTKFLINKEYNLAGIIFPTGDKFTFIPDEQFVGADKLRKVVLSEKMVAIGNDAFSGATSLSEVNFPASLREIGKEAFRKTGITKAELAACTGITRLRYEVFQDTPALTTITFPTNIIEIQNDFCKRSGVTVVDLSECHKLRVIAQSAFAECCKEEVAPVTDGQGNVITPGVYSGLTTVKICAHEKVIRGPHGSGAFNESLAIKEVEVVGCTDPAVTDITKCWCEAGAFTFDVTNAQTSVASVEKAARLTFPRDLPVQNSGNYQNPYTSAFDFFVGDYKEGIPFSQQEYLLDYWYNVPTSSTGTTRLTKEQDKWIGDARYALNGWLEFINTGDPVIIDVEEGKFLRTYSRTEDSGAIILPQGITAYRAIDYADLDQGYVKDKNGEWVLTNPEETDQTKWVFKKKSDLKEDEKILYKKNPTYSLLTIKGQLLLRPLKALKQKMENGETVTYETGESYVPERTGVVLYSTSLTEDQFIIFKEVKDQDGYLLTDYPHTGSDRWEAKRLEEGDTNDNINLLQGSFGSDCPVAPVDKDAWVYADPENCKGGHYIPGSVTYRQFGFNKSLMKWRRLTPGKLRLNRAFAKIPYVLFDNFDEGDGQSPDFNLSDQAVDDPTTTYSNTIFVFGETFEDEVADGIKDINIIQKVVDTDAWYTLQGVKVSQPVKGGVYIHNNKKVVIK